MSGLPTWTASGVVVKSRRELKSKRGDVWAHEVELAAPGVSIKCVVRAEDSSKVLGDVKAGEVIDVRGGIETNFRGDLALTLTDVRGAAGSSNASLAGSRAKTTAA